MQLNDAVPERRNLIVFCMATSIFFIGGGDACSEIKLPLGGIVLTNNTGLIYVYWAVLIYLLLRYWAVFKVTAYDSESPSNFCKKKNWKVAIQEALIRNCDASKIKIPQIWYASGNITELTFSQACEKIGYTSAQAIENIKISRKSNKNEEDTYHLILQITKGKTVIDVVESEKISIKTFQYGPVFTTSLLANVISDKYLFDWVFPWLIFSLTLLIMAISLYLFDYGLCG